MTTKEPFPTAWSGWIATAQQSWWNNQDNISNLLLITTHTHTHTHTHAHARVHTQQLECFVMHACVSWCRWWVSVWSVCFKWREVCLLSWCNRKHDGRVSQRYRFESRWGNGHFFPSCRQLYLSSFSDTHTHTRVPKVWSYITKSSTWRSRCQVYDNTRRTQDSKRPPTMEVTSTFERFARLSFTCSPFLHCTGPWDPLSSIEVYSCLDSGPETGRLWHV